MSLTTKTKNSMNRLIKIMVSTWTKVFNHSKVHDASDLFPEDKKEFRPTIMMGPDGKLYFHSTKYYGELVGFLEWPDETKKYFNIKKSDTVIDCMVKLIEITE